MEMSTYSLTHLEGETVAIIAIGIGLAKNVFAIHDVDEPGKPVLVCPAVKRPALLELIAKPKHCLISMDSLTRLNFH